MKELEVIRSVNKTANRLYPLNIPKEIVYGLGWDDDANASAKITVKLTPKPEEGGFFVEALERNPVSQLRYIYSVTELKKKGLKRSYDNNELKRDKIVNRVQRMQNPPEEFKKNKRFMKLWQKYDKNRKELQEQHTKFMSRNEKRYNLIENLSHEMAVVMEEDWKK
ncbi:MAG: hypothetical protein ACI8Y7_000070 [Candidatus Woesearchaeota archaeon]|jgi:hypothetical protein